MNRNHGFVLGKFCPFHRGHQLLVEAALRECGRVTLLVYPCSFYHIPLSVRANWIRNLYPEVEVIEGWGGPESTGNTPEIMREQEAFIKRMLGSRKITHFFSSEFYGEHVSRALGAIDRRVDEARKAIPISGTDIRTAPFQNRKFVSPVVYRDLIVKVVFLGSVSTGKSTLAEKLACRHSTAFVPEYGREYWETHQVERRLTLEQLEEIGDGHLMREESAFLESDKVCFIDTNAMTTRMFAMDYHGTSTKRLDALADACAARYDLFFLCGDDIPYADTWDRSGDVKRHEFQSRIIADLEARHIPYIPLRGSLDERMATVDHVLSAYIPYSNFFGVAAETNFNLNAKRCDCETNK